MCYLVDLGSMIAGLSAIVLGMCLLLRKVVGSFPSLQNKEFGRRNLSSGSRVELADSEKVGDQHGKKTH